jgi:hypothetical protein
MYSSQTIAEQLEATMAAAAIAIGMAMRDSAALENKAQVTAKVSIGYLSSVILVLTVFCQTIRLC